MKQTKAWADKWLVKLKDDLRAQKADIPVIVSSALPKEMKSPIQQIEGVWVCTYDLSVTLATLLRKDLLDIGYQKAISMHKTEKSDLLYDFITSREFAQQVEVLVEVHQEMQEQVIRERVAFEKSWKAREEQLRRFITSAAKIYGGVQGIAGASMPQVKGLEFPDLLEDGK